MPLYLNGVQPRPRLGSVRPARMLLGGAEVYTPPLFEYKAGDDIAALGGTFSRASTGSYRDADGIIQQAALNALRDAHYVRNPVTGLYERSTLLEGQRTNLVPYSEDFGQWTTLRANVTPESDGYRITSQPVEDSTCRIYVTLSSLIAEGEQVVLTAEVKRGNWDYAVVTMNGSTTSTLQNVVINVMTGEVVTKGSSVNRVDVVALGEGWWRVSVFIPSAASAAALRGPSIGLCDGPGVQSFTSDGSHYLFVRRVQVEKGVTFPSSYIPTSGSPVTRAADSLDLSGIVWEAQTVTRYERRYSLQTGQWEEVYDVAERSGPVPLDLYHAYTHARYEPGTHPIAAMRAAAGAPNP